MKRVMSMHLNLLREAYIYGPWIPQVIDNLKSLHIIFSYATVIIGCHKMYPTPAEQDKMLKLFLNVKQVRIATMFKHFDTSGCQKFQWHLLLHYHHMWSLHRSSLLFCPSAASKNLSLRVISNCLPCNLSQNDTTKYDILVQKISQKRTFLQPVDKEAKRVI